MAPELDPPLAPAQGYRAPRNGQCPRIRGLAGRWDLEVMPLTAPRRARAEGHFDEHFECE